MKLFHKIRIFIPLVLLVFFISGLCETKNEKNAQADSLKSLKTLLEAKLDSIKIKLANLELAEPELPPHEKVIRIKPIKLDSIPLPPPPPAEYDYDGPIYIAYDEAPTPIGGFSTLTSKLIYPKAAREAGIQGRVYVNVSIDADGNVVETKILESLSKECDDMAVMAIKSTKWNPAKQKSKPVKTWVGIPVIFGLGKKEK
jgi:TonB family protein